MIYLSQIMSKPSPLLRSRVNNQKVKKHNSYSLRLFLFVVPVTPRDCSLCRYMHVFLSVWKIIYPDLISRLFFYMIWIYSCIETCCNFNFELIIVSYFNKLFDKWFDKQQRTESTEERLASLKIFALIFSFEYITQLLMSLNI